MEYRSPSSNFYSTLLEVLIYLALQEDIRDNYLNESSTHIPIHVQATNASTRRFFEPQGTSARYIRLPIPPL